MKDHHGSLHVMVIANSMFICNTPQINSSMGLFFYTYLCMCCVSLRFMQNSGVSVDLFLVSSSPNSHNLIMAGNFAVKKWFASFNTMCFKLARAR